jgi:hypothetical protein
MKFICYVEVRIPFHQMYAVSTHTNTVPVTTGVCVCCLRFKFSRRSCHVVSNDSSAFNFRIDGLTLNTKAIGSFATSGPTMPTTQRRIPANGITYRPYLHTGPIHKPGSNMYNKQSKGVLHSDSWYKSESKRKLKLRSEVQMLTPLSTTRRKSCILGSSGEVSQSVSQSVRCL